MTKPSGKKARYAMTRKQKAEAQEWRCFYCQSTMLPVFPINRRSLTLDHLVPLKFAGKSGKKRYDYQENVVAACRDCNSTRGHRPWRLFRFWINARHMGVV